MHVNSLPNECLIKIFKYLSLQDIVMGVRPTCSHWYSLSFNGYLWRHLNLDVGGLASRMSDESFLCLLRSISENVEEIVFGYSCTISEVSILHNDIYCPQLKSVDLRGLNIEAHYIDILLRKYPKMEKLFLELNYSENCIHFFRFLRQYKLIHFKSLHVMLNLEIDDKSLLHNFNLNNNDDEADFRQNLIVVSLNDLLAESITCCTSLQHFSITFSHMTDTTLRQIITKSKHLTHLSVAYCSQICGSAFDGLTPDNQLVSLNMDSTLLNNETISIIASKCPKLKSISLRNCNQVTDEGVLYLAKNCPMINKFIRNHTHFNQHEVSNLIAESSQCYSFERMQKKGISLSTRVTDIGITALVHNCYNLCKLGLAGCTSLTDDAIKQIAICCPNLTLLNLSGCIYISDFSINLVILKCRNLKMLFLQTCYNVTNIWFLNFSFKRDGDIPCLKPPTRPEVNFITSKCDLTCLCSSSGNSAENNICEEKFKQCAFCDVKNYLYSISKVKQDFALTTLNLDFCNQISDDSLCRIAENCPLLCEIWLQGCFRITDYGVGQLAKKCPLLTIFDISGGTVCDDMILTDETLHMLAAHSQKLSYLNLVRNWRFTIDGISAILHNCNKLRKVNISINRKSGVSDISIQNSLDKIFWTCTAIKKVTDSNKEKYLILTLNPHTRRIL